eukprot:979525-Prymnesium_polylepis.1
MLDNLKAMIVMMAAGLVLASGTGESAHRPTTPLHEAIERGDTAAVRALIGQGAELDAHDENEAAPLHVAAVLGFTELVAVLVEAGATLDPQDSHMATPLHWAADRGQAAA